MISFDGSNVELDTTFKRGLYHVPPLIGFPAN